MTSRLVVVLNFLLLYSCLYSSNADDYDELPGELESTLNELDADDKLEEGLTDANLQSDDHPPLERKDYMDDAMNADMEELEDETPLDRLVDKVDHMKEQKMLSHLNQEDWQTAPENEVLADGMVGGDSLDEKDYRFSHEMESFDEELEAKYEPVGCFNDNEDSRTLPERIENFRSQIDWNDLNKTIYDCAELAFSKGYRYFGVQFYGECWSGPGAEKTYDREGTSEDCVAGVGKHWTNYVYRFVEAEDQMCKNYKTLDDKTRSASYVTKKPAVCDTSLTPGWYRFTGNSGSHMATECVPLLHCGTHAPGWMIGKLPTQAEGEVERKVCFTWNDDCCRWQSKTTVKNCGGFYVYKLQDPPACRLRYCGNGIGTPKKILSDVVYTDDKPELREYESLGCFLDKGGDNRPLPVMIGNLRPSIDWSNLNKTIRACARLAQSRGFEYFGIQFWGECWSGATADETFDKDGPSKKCAAGVGDTGSNFVYRFMKVTTTAPQTTTVSTTITPTPQPTTTPDECLAYKVLDSADRAQSQGPLGSGNYKCDKTLTAGWYRFSGSAGTHMATSCVQRFHCGTHSTGWMNDTLPSLAEGRVARQVCFNWNGHCCHWKTTVLVRNCGGFCVYNLRKPPNCRLRYCGNGVLQGTTQQTTNKPMTTRITTPKIPPIPTLRTTRKTTGRTTKMPTTLRTTRMPTTTERTTKMPTTLRTTRKPTTTERTTRRLTTLRPTTQPKLRRFIVCQYRRRILRCPFGKRIRIRYANYGRTSRRVCRHFAIFTTRCFSKRAAFLIRRKCNGRLFCRLTAKNFIYGNPCWGTFKYIHVNYQCI